MELSHYVILVDKARAAGVNPDNLEDMMAANLAASCTSCDPIRLKLKEMIMDVVARSYIKGNMDRFCCTLISHTRLQFSQVGFPHLFYSKVQYVMC